MDHLKIQSNNKNTFMTKLDVNYSKLLQTSRGSLYMGTSGGSDRLSAKKNSGFPCIWPPGIKYSQIWPKITSTIGIMQIISQFEQFIMQSSHENTEFQDKAWWYFFKINCKTQWVYIFLWSPQVVKYPNFDQKWQQILVLCK